MIRAEPITEAEKAKSRGIMDLASRQENLYALDSRLLQVEDGWNSRTVACRGQSETVPHRQARIGKAVRAKLGTGN